MTSGKKRRLLWTVATIVIGILYIVLNKDIVEVIDDASIHAKINSISKDRDDKKETINEVEMIKSSKGFFIGSNKDSVILSLGQPTKKEEEFLNQWLYGESMLYFDRDDLVIGYYNKDELSKGLSDYYSETYGEKSNNEVFIGSTKEQVILSFGPPTYIDHLHPQIWKYRNSTIHFTMKDIVDGYLNYYGEISNHLPKASEVSSTVAIGSSKDDFLNAYGAPSSIESYHPNIWIYKLAKVYFDEEGFIFRIDDSYNDLELD